MDENHRVNSIGAPIVSIGDCVDSDWSSTAQPDDLARPDFNREFVQTVCEVNGEWR